MNDNQTATRDPEPWVSWGVRYATQVSPSCYWGPRPEYDASNAQQNQETE